MARISLKQTATTHYMTMYKIIYVYYLNKYHNSLKSYMTKTTYE